MYFLFIRNYSQAAASVHWLFSTHPVWTLAAFVVGLPFSLPCIVWVSDWMTQSALLLFIIIKHLMKWGLKFNIILLCLGSKSKTQRRRFSVWQSLFYSCTRIGSVINSNSCHVLYTLPADDERASDLFSIGYPFHNGNLLLAAELTASLGKIILIITVANSTLSHADKEIDDYTRTTNRGEGVVEISFYPLL